MRLIDLTLVAIGMNMAWAIGFGVRDHLRRREIGELETNFKIIARNIKCAAINVGIAVALLICGAIRGH